MNDGAMEHDGGLAAKGQALIDAAYEYWKEFHEHGGRGAVVWLQSSGGHLVLFTRGEYRKQLLQDVPMLIGTESTLFEPFAEKEKINP